MSKDILMNYLDGEGESSKPQSQKNSLDSDNVKKQSDLEWTSIPTSILPCSYFYPVGTDILIRAATVKEIQSYSMIDEKNIIDVFEKVNDILENNVQVRLADGEKKLCTYLFDNDKWFVLHIIRDLTFPNKPQLYTKVNDIKIPLGKETFYFHEISKDIANSYNTNTKRFEFENGIKLAPPTIGIQKAFMKYIFETTKQGEKLNMSFIKIAPFMYPGRVSLSLEDVKKALVEYENNMDMDKFLFLDEKIKLMNFGIKGVRANTGEGEVLSDDVFPRGFKGILLSFDTDN